MCTSANMKWIASAEHNKSTGKAIIYVWNAQNFTNIAVLTSTHRGPIHSMAFTFLDKYLVTVGTFKPAPLIIYNWANQVIEVSTVVNFILITGLNRLKILR